jgi:hypothetical protein
MPNGAPADGVTPPPTENPADVQTKTDQAAQLLAEENDRHLKKMGKAFLWVLVVAAVGAIAVAYRWCGQSSGCESGEWTTWSPARRSFIVTTGATATIIWLLSWWRSKSGGLRALLLGKDNRFSTGAVQAGIWTLALAYALLLLALEAPFGSTTFTKTFQELDVNYLLLLGGPFAAAGLSRVATGKKVEDGEVQKTDAITTSLGDVVSDDDGQTDLVDMQFLVFNLIVLVFFAAILADKPHALPNLPLGLVGLTSLSAITYAGTKASMNNAPVITSIAKLDGTGAVRPGDQVLLLGANFVPPGADLAHLLVRVRVRFGEHEMSVITQYEQLQNKESVLSSDRIVVRVPEDVPAVSTAVTVVTAAGVESDAYPLLIVPDVPVITGAAKVPVEKGRKLLVTGRFFQRPGIEGQATVWFDNIPVRGRETKGTRVEATAPHGLGETVAIKVRAFGGLVDSEPVTLPVD